LQVSSPPALPIAEYCREIEQYLCRRNGGHLIRIVGPAFEKVTAWAGQGIPIRVAFRGIDRCIEREEAKGPRRRPVRVEFCEADVLDAFDDWRRAVGTMAGVAQPPEAADSTTADSTSEGARDVSSGAAAASVGGARSRRVALQAHVDRVMARLTQRRIEPDVQEELARALDRALAELDALRGDAHGARGERRDEVKNRLRDIDAMLMQAVRDVAASADVARVEAEARRDLEPFRGRMRADAFERAVAEEATRQLREALRLPDVGAV
jgi:hypothetical protein